MSIFLRDVLTSDKIEFCVLKIFVFNYAALCFPVSDSVLENNFYAFKTVFTFLKKMKKSYSRSTCSKMEKNYSAFKGWSCHASQVEGLVHPSVDDGITASR